jgi:hypothetical protein
MVYNKDHLSENGFLKIINYYASINKRNILNYVITPILSHFTAYPLCNLKQKDFICFKEAMLLIEGKTHLTREGLDKIKSLSSEMNSNRLN